MRKIIKLLAIAGFVALSLAASQNNANSIKQKLAERATPVQKQKLIQKPVQTEEVKPTVLAESTGGDNCYCPPPCLINKCLESHEIAEAETELEVNQELEIKTIPDRRTIHEEETSCCSSECGSKHIDGNGHKTRNFCISGNICVDEECCFNECNKNDNDSHGCAHKITVGIDSTEAGCLDEECYKVKAHSPLDVEH